jgi:hypothetical protein
MKLAIVGAVRRTSGILGLAVAALMLGASPAGAFTYTQTGPVGHWAFADAEAAPAAKCIYTYKPSSNPGVKPSRDIFTGIKVNGPEVEYPDNNADVLEHGQVGFRIRIQEEVGDDWKIVKKSSETRMNVREDAYKFFKAKTLNWHGPTKTGIFRASLRLIWYKPNGKIYGSLQGYVDYHRTSYNHDVSETCPGKISFI